MKVGIITFHASHNYGSMLQAYALQQTVMKLGHECEIINFRTERQKKIYHPFFMENRFKAKAMALLYPKMAFNDWRKYRLFERFLKDKFILSEKEYSTSEELADARFDYDAYISGSDQIWNTRCSDFDWAYYLNFVGKGKRIAYAPSMGPIPEQHVLFEYNPKIAYFVAKYDSLSVREQRSLNRIHSIGVKKDLIVTLDPTLLLSKEIWENLISTTPLVKGEYIFLYTPWYNDKIYEDASCIAKEINTKIVVSKFDGYRKWKSNEYFEFHTKVGPLEFLNLIKNSKLVIARSFHAVVFSLLFNKSFIIAKEVIDSRIDNLLIICGCREKYKRYGDYLFYDASDTIIFYNQIVPAVKNSIKFLKETLV